MAAQARSNYLSVRFGNVLGTCGSVLTALSAQVAAGGPVTVTNPEVTRYFMTVDEAVQLVLQAAVRPLPADRVSRLDPGADPVRLREALADCATDLDSRLGQVGHPPLKGSGPLIRKLEMAWLSKSL